MPRADYEALKARRQAQRDRGAESDNSTNEEENKAAIEDSMEAYIPRTTTTMFQHLLIVNQDAAESLYNDQMITTIEIL